MENYSSKNAQAVLNKLNSYIERGCSLPMRYVYRDLSIFDWWTETLSVAKMKQMRTFLIQAIKHGFTGYVCFKVGASGCANGMWAYKVETTDGYSPDGDFMYRSFTPDYTYWSMKLGDKSYPACTNEEFDSCKTIKALDALLANASVA